MPDGAACSNKSAGSARERFRHAALKRALLAENETFPLREAEIFCSAGVGAQARPVGVIGGETVERDQRERDVVRAFVRQEIADEIAAAARNDGGPAARVFLERIALERIEHVADAAGDRHGGLRCRRQTRMARVRHASAVTEVSYHLVF